MFERLLLSVAPPTKDLSALSCVLHVFCFSLRIDKQMVKTVVQGQVASAIFSFSIYFYFFLQYAAPFHLLCSICLIYKGKKRNEDNTWPAVVCWEKCVIEENNQKEIGLYFSIYWNSWSYFSLSGKYSKGLATSQENSLMCSWIYGYFWRLQCPVECRYPRKSWLERRRQALFQSTQSCFLERLN